MTLAEKITRAKTDYDDVFDAGYEKGKAEGGGSSGGGGTPTTNVLAKALLPKQTSFENLFKGYSDMTDEDLAFAGFTKENTSKVTIVNSMFNGCSKITKLPEMDLSNCTRMINFVNGCSNLKTVPLYDTRNVTHMGTCFYICNSLTDIPAWDMRSCSDAGSMFQMGSAVNVQIKNIKTSLSFNFCTNLTRESAIHLIKECRTVVTEKTLTLPKKFKDDFTNTYVKVVSITDEMRAEDDLIDEKFPFVECASTDEYARTLLEYMNSKNWNITFS